MNALETQFFLLPRFLRKAVWFVIRRNPYWFKDVAGTAAVTSLGMYASGSAAGIPITPMTLTLTIGTIEKKPALEDIGQLVEREVVHLVLSVDHDVVDGAPLMRFTERFKQLLRDGTALQEAGPILRAAKKPVRRDRRLWVCRIRGAQRPLVT